MGVEVSVSLYPCGRWCLDVIGASEATYAVFDARRLQGGGYTWEGILRALVKMHLPHALSQLDFGAEADNEVIRSAQQAEMLGYILAGAGILLVIAAIPLGIYLDRRKKARKRSAQRLPDTGRSSNAEKP